MSGPRVSSRVLELEARAREAKHREELAAFAIIDETVSVLVNHLNTGLQVQEDFTLPAEWLSHRRTKRVRSNIVDDDSDDEESVAEVSKIPRFRRLKQNLYKAPLQRPSLPLEECTSSCGCKFGTGCGSRCHNRLVYMECVPGQCPSLFPSQVCQPTSSKSRLHSSSTSEVVIKTEPGLADEQPTGTDPGSETVRYCENTAIQTRTYPQVEVFQIAEPPTVPPADATDTTTSASSSRAKRSRTDPFLNTTSATNAPDTRGYGLRLLEPVRKGTLIIEYLGEVITAQEGLRRMGEYVTGDDFYFMGLDNGLMLDAKTMGSVARFANHSCAPTCLLQKWNVLGECRLVLVSRRDLPAGAELTYNYHYFDDNLEGVRGMKRQRCLCGAKHCCGTIGGRVTKRTSASASTSQQTSGNTRKRGRPTTNIRAPLNQENTAKPGESALVSDAVDSEDEYESVSDMYKRCVSMQLLPKKSNVSSHSGSGVDGSSSSSNDLSEHNATTSLSTTAKKYSPETLLETARDIRTCIQKATLLGLTNVTTTKFITNNDGIVSKLNALATELEGVVGSVDAWVVKYDKLFGAGGVEGTAESGADGMVGGAVELTDDTTTVANTTTSSGSSATNSSTTNSIRMIYLATAQELLSQAPKSARIEQALTLENNIRAVLRARKVLQPLCDGSGGGSASVGSGERSGSGASGSGVNASTPAPPTITWDELISTTRLILSSLPISCGDAYIVALFRQFEAYSVWVRGALSGVVGSSGGRVGRKSSVGVLSGSTGASFSGSSNSSSGSGNGSGSSKSKVVVAGLESDSVEYDEYALLTRLLDTYCQRQRLVVTLRGASANASTVVTESLSIVVKIEGGAANSTSVVSTTTSHPSDVQVVHAVVSTNHVNGNNSGTSSSQVVIKTEPTTSTTITKAKTALVKPTPKRTHLTITLPLLADMFTAAQYYDQRLSTYMQKLETEQAIVSGSVVKKNYEQMITQVPVQQSSGGLYFDSAVDLFKQWETSTEGVLSIRQCYERILHTKHNTTSTVTPTPNKSNVNSKCDPLYCLCRLPEHDGESNILTECSVCCNWYHPQCINSHFVTLSAVAKQKLFVCPVCLHLDSAVSSVAFAPNEWGVIKSKNNTNSSASSGSASGTSSNGKSGGTAGGKRGSSDAGANTTANTTDIPDTHDSKRKRTTGTNNNTSTTSSNHPISIKYTTASTVKSKAYLTLEELTAAVEQQQSLAIKATPVSLLLGLARKYCSSWQHEVHSFLESVPVGKLLNRVGGYVSGNGSSVSGSSGSGSGSVGVGGGASRSSSDNSVGNGGADGVAGAGMELPLLPSDVLIQEAIILQRTLQLYLQLRIVRVRCAECTVLRQLAWIITVSTLYRRVGSGVSGGIVLTVSELSDIVAGGAALFGFGNCGVGSGSSADVVDLTDSIGESADVTTHTISTTTTTSIHTPDYNKTVSRVLNTGAALLHLLTLRQTRTATLLAQAGSVGSRDAARVLLPRFHALRVEVNVKIEDSYVFARTKCLCRVVADSTTNDTTTTTTTVVNTTDAAYPAPAEVNTLESLDILHSTGARAGLGFYLVENTNNEIATHTNTTINDATTSTTNSSTTTTNNPTHSTPHKAKASKSASTTPSPLVYCWCRKIDTGTAMVCCDTCEEWFHCHCVGLNKLSALNRGKNKDLDGYVCISCCVLAGKTYPHAW